MIGPFETEQEAVDSLLNMVCPPGFKSCGVVKEVKPEHAELIKETFGKEFAVGWYIL